MPRLAIVISAFGRVDLLESTLLSVLENRPADCEILVALDQSYADPYDLKTELQFVACSAGNSPMRSINTALSATRPPFVHLLSSGCQVTEGWTNEALARFGDRKVGAVAPLALEAERTDRIFAAGVGYRASGKRYLVGSGQPESSSMLEGAIVGPGGFAAFYRKAALDLVGGLSTQLRLQADVDLALCLAKAGFSSVLEPKSRVLARREVDIDSSAFRKALCDERLFWRNVPRTAWFKPVAAHALAVTGELLGSIPPSHTSERRFSGGPWLAASSAAMRGIAGRSSN